MITSLVALLALATVADDRAAPAAAASEKDRIVGFLKDHVIGRTFTAERYVVKIAGGKQEAEAEVSVTFADLAETRHGFYFDRAMTRKQTNYDLDASGNRTGKKYVKDSQSVTRLFLGATKSTGRVLGYTVDSFDSSDWPYATELLQMRLADDKLTLIRSSELYGDLYAKGDMYRPGVVRIRDVFSAEKDGVKMTDQEFGYDINARAVEDIFENPWAITPKLSDTGPPKDFWSRQAKP